jgi:hypothetical protein
LLAHNLIEIYLIIARYDLWRVCFVDGQEQGVPITQNAIEMPPRSFRLSGGALSLCPWKKKNFMEEKGTGNLTLVRESTHKVARGQDNYLSNGSGEALPSLVGFPTSLAASSHPLPRDGGAGIALGGGLVPGIVRYGGDGSKEEGPS